MVIQYNACYLAGVFLSFYVQKIMRYSKTDLAFHYSWPERHKMNYTGTPSRRWFDPNNGQQLLFIINCFYDSIGLQSPEVGKRIEHLIYTQMPLEKMSELTVFKWLSGIYPYHAERYP